MATYLIENEINLSRQEGDTSDIKFKNIPIQLNLTGATAWFEVKKKSKLDTRIIGKTNINGYGITISGQDLTISLLPNDTKTFSGRWRWELQVTLANSVIITIGRGFFNIIPELIN